MASSWSSPLAFACIGNDVHDNRAASPALGQSTGIELLTTQLSDISQNVVHHNGGNGIEVRVGSTRNDVRGNQVHDNGTQWVTAPGAAGILLTGGGTHENRIDENEVVANNGWGIALTRPQGTAPIVGHLVRRNRAHENQRSGIAIMNAATNNFVTENDARRNNLSGLPPCYECNLVDLFTPGGNVWARNLGTFNLTDACRP